MTELQVINQSQVKSWRRCQMEWKFKFQDQLRPKRRVLPLYKGSWVHACLETHYKQGDWTIGYNTYLDEYNSLFDEEREVLDKKGKLDDQVKRIVQSYLWYTRKDNWKVILVEKTFDFKYEGVRIKGTIDLVIEDLDTGMTWMLDHKTASQIPTASSFHAMDPQLFLYPWALEKVTGMEIDGIMWNYLRSRAPSIPKINKDGSLSKRKILTDYPTAYRFLKNEGYDPNDFSDMLRPLMRNSPFIRRYRLPREKSVTDRIIREYLTTAWDIQDAYAGARKLLVRTITRDCPRCDYQELCQAELNGMNTEAMIKASFVKEDSTQKHGDYFDPEFESLDD
jgi:hypothetical protein